MITIYKYKEVYANTEHCQKKLRQIVRNFIDKIHVHLKKSPFICGCLSYTSYCLDHEDIEKFKLICIT